MANINETFRYIEYSDESKFTRSKDGRIELKKYSDDLLFYSPFDSSLGAEYAKGPKSPETEGTVTNVNDAVFGQSVHIQNGKVTFDKDNFKTLKDEGSISFRIKTDFNNAVGEQSFVRTESPIITSLPTVTDAEYKFGGRSLELIGDEEKRVEYSVDNVQSMVQEGTIDFFFKPNYEGTPNKDVQFFDLYNEQNDNNRILIVHRTDGKIHSRIYDQTGEIKVEISFDWSASKEWTNISFNFDLNNGVSRVFVNGTQYGSTSNETGTRTALTEGYMAFGSTYPQISNYYLDDFAIFDTVKRTSNYSVRTNAMSTDESGLIALARFNSNTELNVGEETESIKTIPETSDYKFRLYVDQSNYGGDIAVSLNTDDDMTDVFNKVAAAINNTSANVNVEQKPEGNILIKAQQNGASILIDHPEEGRDLLQILDGVNPPRLPNGPGEDTSIVEFNNEINDRNRISIVHTNKSHIVIKMWDDNAKLVVNEDCGEWTNWSHYWYAFEFNWSESLAQLFIDGNMIKVVPTGFTRKNNGEKLTLRSAENDYYKFDELIVYNKYKNSKNYTPRQNTLSPYADTNPYIDIHFGEGFKEDEVVDLNLNCSSNVHFTVNLGSSWYYYNAGSWRNGDGSFAQTNKPSVIETKFPELFFSEYDDLVIRAYFSSNGYTIQWLDDLSIVLETQEDSSAMIIGSVQLDEPVDLSSDQHVVISTNRTTEEIDLVSEVEGEPARVVGTEDLSSGFDWEASPSSFNINGEEITLDEATTSLKEVVELIADQLPEGLKVLKEDEYLVFKTEEKSEQAYIDLSGDALTELGFDDDIWYGEDPDYTSVDAKKIVEAINKANVNGLAPANLDSNNRLVLRSKDTGEDAYVAISEGITSDALDVIWGYATSDSGEQATGPFVDYGNLKDWIREQLGAPIVPVELTEEQLENCISLAVHWYNYYRNSKENKIHVQLEGNPREGYKIPEEVGGEEDIIEVIVRPRFPFAYYTGGDVDSIMSNIYMQWMFQRGRHAGFNDFLGDYYITLSTEKDYNIILGTEIRWRFYNGRLFLNPEPTGMDVILVFRSALTIEEINTNTLIREYSLGEAKKVLGNIRSTFGGSIPAGTETVDLNGDALKSEGKEEVEAALEKMKGLMEPFGFDFG